MTLLDTECIIAIDMPLARRLLKPITKLRTNNVKQCKTLSPLVNKSPYIDPLPEDIMTKIYRYKHELEFYSTLETIKKFTHLKPEGVLKSNIPLKILLSPVTQRKLFHLDVEQYEGDIEFKGDKEKLNALERQYNIKINLNKPNDPLNVYDYGDKYTDARIKWNNDSKVLMLDVICITNAIINFSCDGYVLCGFEVEDLNRKKDDITLNFAIL